MTHNEVMNIIKSLSYSQGFYGRLLRAIEEAPEEEKDTWLSQFSGCTNPVDVIMMIEG